MKPTLFTRPRIFVYPLTDITDTGCQAIQVTQLFDAEGHVGKRNLYSYTAVDGKNYIFTYEQLKATRKLKSLQQAHKEQARSLPLGGFWKQIPAGKEQAFLDALANTCGETEHHDNGSHHPH